MRIRQWLCLMCSYVSYIWGLGFEGGLFPQPLLGRHVPVNSSFRVDYYCFCAWLNNNNVFLLQLNADESKHDKRKTDFLKNGPLWSDGPAAEGVRHPYSQPWLFETAGTWSDSDTVVYTERRNIQIWLKDRDATLMPRFSKVFCRYMRITAIITVIWQIHAIRQHTGPWVHVLSADVDTAQVYYWIPLKQLLGPWVDLYRGSNCCWRVLNWYRDHPAQRYVGSNLLPWPHLSLSLFI